MEKMYKKSFHVAKVQLNTDLFPQDDYKKKNKRGGGWRGRDWEREKKKSYTGAKFILNTSFIGTSSQTNHRSSPWIEQITAIKELSKQPAGQTILSVSKELIDLSEATAFNRIGK